jgi:hypothetical protein
MQCPNCGELIPDISYFCMFCGERVREEDQEAVNLPLNMRFPIEIAAMAMWFEGDVEETTTLLGRRRIARRVAISFQLRDDLGLSTAYNGKTQFKLECRQYMGKLVGRERVNRAQFSEEFHVTTDDFYRSTTRGYEGEIWCKFTLARPFDFDAETEVHGVIELWFTPEGTRSRLYRTHSKTLIPTFERG